MKRKVIISLIIGFVLIILSLFYKTSAQNIEPMPYTGIGNGNHVINGVLLLPNTNNTVIAKRGLPLPIVSVRSDGDSVGNYYREINAGNLIMDYLVFSSITFFIIYIFSIIKKKI